MFYISLVFAVETTTNPEDDESGASMTSDGVRSFRDFGFVEVHTFMLYPNKFGETSL